MSNILKWRADSPAGAGLSSMVKKLNRNSVQKMQDRLDAGQEGCGQGGCRTGRMQGGWDAGQVGCLTGSVKDRRGKGMKMR